MLRSWSIKAAIPSPSMFSEIYSRRFPHRTESSSDILEGFDEFDFESYNASNLTKI